MHENTSRKPLELLHVNYKQLHHSFGWERTRAWNKMCIISGPVHDYTDTIMPLHLGQSNDEILGDASPVPFWERKAL